MGFLHFWFFYASFFEGIPTITLSTLLSSICANIHRSKGFCGKSIRTSQPADVISTWSAIWNLNSPTQPTKGPTSSLALGCAVPSQPRYKSAQVVKRVASCRETGQTFCTDSLLLHRFNIFCCCLRPPCHWYLVLKRNILVLVLQVLMNSYLAFFSFHIQDGQPLLGDCLAHAFGGVTTSRRKKEKNLASASSNPSWSYGRWLGVCRRSLPPIFGQFKWHWKGASWPPWWLQPWSRKRS